jgi:hypothetical protein
VNIDFEIKNERQDCNKIGTMLGGGRMEEMKVREHG